MIKQYDFISTKSGRHGYILGECTLPGNFKMFDQETEEELTISTKDVSWLNGVELVPPKPTATESTPLRVKRKYGSDTQAERAYQALLYFKDSPRTKDDVVAKMDELFGFNPAQHNSVAPAFSPGTGGLWDQQRVVLVSKQTGTTRSGDWADEWVTDEYATDTQKQFSDAAWEMAMGESLERMKKQLVELPKKIERLETTLLIRKNRLEAV